MADTPMTLNDRLRMIAGWHPEHAHDLEEAASALETLEKRVWEEAANWLRRNANAEKNADKRAAFIEAHNALRARAKGDGG